MEDPLFKGKNKGKNELLITEDCKISLVKK